MIHLVLTRAVRENLNEPRPSSRRHTLIVWLKPKPRDTISSRCAHPALFVEPEQGSREHKSEGQDIRFGRPKLCPPQFTIRVCPMKDTHCWGEKRSSGFASLIAYDVKD